MTQRHMQRKKKEKRPIAWLQSRDLREFWLAPCSHKVAPCSLVQFLFHSTWGEPAQVVKVQIFQSLGRSGAVPLSADDTRHSEVMQVEKNGTIKLGETRCANKSWDKRVGT